MLVYFKIQKIEKFITLLYLYMPNTTLFIIRYFTLILRFIINFIMCSKFLLLNN